MTTLNQKLLDDAEMLEGGLMLPNEKKSVGSIDMLSRGIYSQVADTIEPKRIDDPLETNGIDLSDYVSLINIDTPSTPQSGNIKLYYDSDGDDTNLFALDSDGTPVELIGNTITKDFTISSATVGSLEINGVGNAAEYSKLILTANSGNSWTWRHEADNDLKLRYYDGSTTTDMMQITSAGKVRILNENLDVYNGKYLKIWDSGNIDSGQIEHTGWGMTLSTSKGDIGIYPQDYTNFLNGPARFFHTCNYQKGTDTIAAGVITRDQSYMAIETQGGAASDNLDTIQGGEEGDILILEALNSTHTVVVKDGTGNINGPGDVTLNHAEDKVMLIFNGSEWDVISSSNNS